MIARRTKTAVVIGAGPAGLAAAGLLQRRGVATTVVEQNPQTGGLSQTFKMGAYRYDIGGHRFFTPDTEIHDFVVSTLGAEGVWVDRTSHIYQDGRFFDYPLSAINAAVGIGPTGMARAAGSLVWYRLLNAAGMLDLTTFEGWTQARFGDNLYRRFFGDYTEKVWGVSCKRLSADWARQRIRDLSLSKAIFDALTRTPAKNGPATLLKKFLYPRLGIGQLSQLMANEFVQAGGDLRLNSRVVGVESSDDRVLRVVLDDGQTIEGEQFLFTNPLPQTAAWLGARRKDLQGIRYRGIMTVFLTFKRNQVTTDNWIYFPDKNVPFGRMHEPRNWSRAMAPDGHTSLVVEYFAFPHDPSWERTDADLIEDTVSRLEKMGFVQRREFESGEVRRLPNAYPLYEIGYEARVAELYRRIEEWRNVEVVGRTGMFRYHNIDHAIRTGWEGAKVALGERGDPFAVNQAGHYHEDGRHGVVGSEGEREV